MTTYSHSRLSTFETCPRRFAYRYVEKVEVETEGVEAFVGKRVHELLERLYHHVARYGQPPSLRQVLDRYEKDWRAAWHDQITIVRDELGPEQYRERGERCLENYYRRYYPFADGECVGIEERLHLQLDDGGAYRMVGVVDRISRSAPGHYEIHDYKTGARLPSQRQIDSERQLALYQIGLQQTYSDVEQVDLVYHFLQHNRSLRTQRSRVQLDELRGQTIELIDQIEAAREYPARPSPLCSWCDFRGLCPDARGRTSAEPGRGPAPPMEPEREPTTEPVAASAEAGQQLSLL